tara:strand:+ start:708 stop:1655 length:948 start_codon:yes stop_codon:yes gene_type:complete
MIDYQKAPYLELDNYKSPKGLNSIFIPMNDGKRIRLIYWKTNLKNKSNGTILLQQGHNEFIEKYFETVQEFLDRSFNVVSFDWRGQGISDKMINNNHKQFIDDFNIHHNDLEVILNSFIKKNFPGPLIGIGHSMGGCILLSFLKTHDDVFDRVILSAPMLGFRNEKLLMPFISLANILFPKKSYLIGSKPNMGKETLFEDNDLTTDEGRYLRTLKLVRKKPEIRLWGITNAWANAAKKEILLMRDKGWAEDIKYKILFLNSLNDRVVSPQHIINMSERLKNSKIINFSGTEHEIFMEKDKFRNEMWNEIDNFLNS